MYSLSLVLWEQPKVFTHTLAVPGTPSRAASAFSGASAWPPAQAPFALAAGSPEEQQASPWTTAHPQEELEGADSHTTPPRSSASSLFGLLRPPSFFPARTTAAAEDEALPSLENALLDGAPRRRSSM